MSKKKLYNPSANDGVRSLIKGDTTNLMNLYDIKYPWAMKIWDEMLSNAWVPEKSTMADDKNSFTKLSAEEQEAYLMIISFLIFLDSIQTNNVPRISEYITAPEVVLALSRQTFDEALHSRSYGHILTSIFNKEQANKAIYYWRDNKVLAERNEYIAKIYQDFNDNYTDEGLVKVIIANYLLEGLYFYNGFNFFYNLDSRHMMGNTAVQIRWIQRDEIRHCKLFKEIILGIQTEEPELWQSCVEDVKDMFRVAVSQEIAFSNEAIGDKILGMSKKSIEDYTYYRANLLLKSIKMDELFEKRSHPYKHLEKLAGVEVESSSKTNMFESQSIAYKQASIITGWDEI